MLVQGYRTLSSVFSVMYYLVQGNQCISLVQGELRTPGGSPKMGDVRLLRPRQFLDGVLCLKKVASFEIREG